MSLITYGDLQILPDYCASREALLLVTFVCLGNSDFKSENLSNEGRLDLGSRFSRRSLKSSLGLFQLCFATVFLFLEIHFTTVRGKEEKLHTKAWWF